MNTSLKNFKTSFCGVLENMVMHCFGEKNHNLFNKTKNFFVSKTMEALEKLRKFFWIQNNKKVSSNQTKTKKTLISWTDEMFIWACISFSIKSDESN